MADSFLSARGPLGLPNGVAIGGGAAVLAAIYFYRKNKATAPAKSMTANPTTTDTTGYSPSDIAAAMSQMGATVPVYGNPAPVSVAGSTTMAGQAPTPYVQPSGEVQTGSGYGLPPGSSQVLGSDNHTYVGVSQPQAQSLKQSGRPTYYQPVPGIFLQVPGNVQLGAGTPQFTQIS